MNHNRFRESLSTIREGAPQQVSSLNGFVACPLQISQYGAMGHLFMMQQVYLIAMEQARAVAQPSRLERLQAFQSN